MPFGAVYATLVFGVLGPWLGVRLLAASAPGMRASGVLLAVLGVSIAIGLLLRHEWARWAGAASAIWLVLASVGEVRRGGGVLEMLVLLASLLLLPLLLLPATGRFSIRDPLAPPRRAWPGRVLAATVALSLVGLLGANFVPAPPGAARAASLGKMEGPVEWLDFAPGIERARAEGKPMLVDFYAVWCAPCKDMEKRTFRDDRVVELLKQKVVPVRVDAEEETERHGLKGYDLAERYDVMSYPTIALLDGNGKVIARASGFFGPDRFVRWLDDALSRSAEAAPPRT